jgi:N-acetylglucosamine-6-phosphate deacetylase
MGPIHHREPGVAGTVLADDRLTCDLICDGHHVHPAIVRVAARVLGERLVLITDRVDLADGAPGPSALGTLATGAEGEPWRRVDGTIAGSRLGLGTAVRNARQFAAIGLRDAVAACTLRPARMLGVERERGTLRRGARADLALLDPSGRVVETWIAGVPVWSAGSKEADERRPTRSELQVARSEPKASEGHEGRPSGGRNPSASG